MATHKLILAQIVQSPEQLVMQCLPAIKILESETKRPNLWGCEGALLENTGFSDLRGQITECLALQEGGDRAITLAVCALMLAALFPGLWPEEEMWEAYSDELTEDLTGAIVRGSGKGSVIAKTALTPLELVMKYGIGPTR